jgi:hypothetical protein
MSSNDLAEDSMFGVEVWTWRQCNEELRAVGVFPPIRHADKPLFVYLPPPNMFVVELAAID